MIIRTPDDLVEKMLQEGTNSSKPYTLVLLVKQLIKKTANETIKAYAEDEEYLCQFRDELDISVLNKL